MAFIAIFSLLGTLGLTGLGRVLFTLFSIIMGKMAWLIPFLCLIFAFILWPSSVPNDHSRRTRSDVKRRKSTYATSSIDKRVNSRASKKAAKDLNTEEKHSQKQAFPLPATKIVPMRGFDNYFASKWSEEVNLADPNKMAELGNDFPSYFGEGQQSFYKPPVKITSLKGLKSYIEEVDLEVKKGLVDQKSSFLENGSVTTWENSSPLMFPKKERGLVETNVVVLPKIVQEEKSELVSQKFNLETSVGESTPKQINYNNHNTEAEYGVQASIPEKQDQPLYGVTPQERELLLGRQVKVANQEKSFISQSSAEEVSATYEPKAEEIRTIAEDLTIERI